MLNFLITRGCIGTCWNNVVSTFSGILIRAIILDINLVSYCFQWWNLFFALMSNMFCKQCCVLFLLGVICDCHVISQQINIYICVSCCRQDERLIPWWYVQSSVVPPMSSVVPSVDLALYHMLLYQPQAIRPGEVQLFVQHLVNLTTVAQNVWMYELCLWKMWNQDHCSICYHYKDSSLCRQ